MDRNTIDERLSMALATMCVAVSSKQPGDLRLAKANVLDVVEDLTREAVTDFKFHQTFGSDDPMLKIANR